MSLTFNPSRSVIAAITQPEKDYEETKASRNDSVSGRNAGVRCSSYDLCGRWWAAGNFELGPKATAAAATRLGQAFLGFD